MPRLAAQPAEWLAGQARGARCTSPDRRISARTARPGMGRRGLDRRPAERAYGGMDCYYKTALQQDRFPHTRPRIGIEEEQRHAAARTAFCDRQMQAGDFPYQGHQAVLPARRALSGAGPPRADGIRHGLPAPRVGRSALPARAAQGYAATIQFWSTE